MIREYLDRITSEHRGKNNFDACIRAKLKATDNVWDAAVRLLNAFSVEEAVGVQLDALGEWVGVERQLEFQPADGSPPLMDDTTYRSVLKMRIAQNNWNGRNESLPGIWTNLFDSAHMAVQDNQDMSMTVLITGSYEIDDVLSKIQMVKSGYVVPKPEGVRLGIEIRENLIAYTGPYMAPAVGYVVDLKTEPV